MVSIAFFPRGVGILLNGVFYLKKKIIKRNLAICWVFDNSHKANMKQQSDGGTQALVLCGSGSRENSSRSCENKLVLYTVFSPQKAVWETRTWFFALRSNKTICAKCLQGEALMKPLISGTLRTPTTQALVPTWFSIKCSPKHFAWWICRLVCKGHKVLVDKAG